MPNCFFFPTDAGVPVYFYEFQESPSILKKMRPSFVRSDHGDEILFVLGLCFTEALVKLNGKNEYYIFSIDLLYHLSKIL